MQLVENDGTLNVSWRNGLACSEVVATLILSTRIKFTLLQCSGRSSIVMYLYYTCLNIHMYVNPVFHILHNVALKIRN